MTLDPIVIKRTFSDRRQLNLILTIRLLNSPPSRMVRRWPRIVVEVYSIRFWWHGSQLQPTALLSTVADWSYTASWTAAWAKSAVSEDDIWVSVRQWQSIYFIQFKFIKNIRLFNNVLLDTKGKRAPESYKNHFSIPVHGFRFIFNDLARYFACASG